MICFAWSGFPQYAARCVGAFVKSTSESVRVLATPPDIPIKGMDALAGCPVTWVDPQAEVPIETPDVLIVSGWAIPVFNRLAERVRATGGKVIAMNDANLILSWKEYLRALRFRLLLARKFDAYFVPGNAGVRLMRFYGVAQERIFKGMYSADASLFHDGKPLPERPKRMVYVGRFNDRKNVLRLCDAFIRAGGEASGWTLALYGCGPLKEALPQHPAIEVNDFVQPEQLGEIYRNARCFALASLEEHWGLVVHEAALSGCVLALSNCIGAAEDLLSEHNGVSFNPTSLTDMTRALHHVFQMTDAQLLEAQEHSLSLAKRIGLNSFVAGLTEAIAHIRLC